MTKESKKNSIREKTAGGSVASEDLPMIRELIVIARPEVGIRVTKVGVASAVGADVTPLADFLSLEDITIQPLFGVSEEKLKQEASSFTAATAVELPDLSVYYRVQAPDERLDKIAESLTKLEAVQAAYVKPQTELPQIFNDMVPFGEEAPPSTPDFTGRQGYLETAPEGIDARYAWTLPGGAGQGVKIIDIEGAWRFTHEDLLQNQGGVVGGTPTTNISWRNHGTAVIGEFSGDRNTFGINGICPDANVRAISIFGELGSSGAIRQAADMLNPGDIILIELHRPGPRHNFQLRNDQRGYIAIEWWPDDFDAIRYAISKGVIVIEAAGNGAENLDDPIYNNRPLGFPVSWTNPFNRANRDSGAIMAGAGNPPAGTHGRNAHPVNGETYVDRARCGFSNFGALIDTQGWGWEVTTCGYGDLQGGSNEDFWYTDEFSGTSSASPIIVGTMGCIQGILRAQGKNPLTPTHARDLLQITGSPQQDAPGRPRTQRIGNRPDLGQLIPRATETEPSDGFWYTVKSGDWLDGIAKRNGLSSWKDIYYHEKNKAHREKRKDPNKLYPGDKLWIPRPPANGSLMSPRFADDPILQAIARNERLLRKGEKGQAVEKIQQALMDLGFPLPRFGADGDFGNETMSAVRNYQSANGLIADGIVGPITIKSLDAQFAS